MSAERVVAITGANGRIGEHLVSRVAAGDLFGPDTPISLRLLEVPPVMKKLEGFAMELQDMASPVMRGIELTDDPAVAFDGAQVIFLVGSMPRKEGMQRSDLLRVNGDIFVHQGSAINNNADADLHVLVVGNPANTNALIAAAAAPDVPTKHFSAMTRLDHNRATALLAQYYGVSAGDLKNVIIWGNHSNTMVPDIQYASMRQKDHRMDQAYYEQTYVPRVRTRGSSIIEARGSSSAPSAAQAAIDAMRDWVNGTPDWISMAVESQGEYDVPAGLFSSFPCTTSDGSYTVVNGLSLTPFVQAELAVSAQELATERETVRTLFPTLDL